MVTIINRGDLPYSSYVILGLQELVREIPLRLNLLDNSNLQKEAKAFFDIMVQHDIKSTMLICYHVGSVKKYVAIDMSDSSDPTFRGSYNRNLLAHVDAYLKLNMNKKLIENDHFLNKNKNKIFDLQFCFGIRPNFNFGLFANQSGKGNFIRKVNDLVDDLTTYKTLMTIDYIRKIRNIKKIYDYTFLVSYYPHPDHKADNEFRLELITKLNENKNITGLAAFASKRPLPTPYSRHTTQFLPLKTLYASYAQSRVGIYVRGLHKCISFKLGQYFALGLPVIGQPIFPDNKFVTDIPNSFQQFSYETPDEIIRNLIYFLENGPEFLSGLSRDNLAYFENCITPLKTAEYILDVARSC